MEEILGIIPLENLFIWLVWNVLWETFSGTSNWNVAISQGAHRPRFAVEGCVMSVLVLFKITMVNSRLGGAVYHPDVSLKTLNGLFFYEGHVILIAFSSLKKKKNSKPFK